MFVTSENFDLPPYELNVDKSINTFNDFVDKIERKYLIQVLGRNLYDYFVAGLSALPLLWDDTTGYLTSDQVVFGNDIWEAVQDNTGISPNEGVDWTKVVTDNRWLVLRNGGNYLVYDKKYVWGGVVEALIPLIYSLWVQSRVITFTGTGFVAPKQENGLVVNPREFIADSWNEWSRLVGNCYNVYDTLYGHLYFTNLQGGTFDDTFDSTFSSFVDYLSYSFISQGTKNIFDL